MTLERSLEDVQVAIAVDLAELFLGFEHAGGDPPQRHLAGSPAFDVAVRVPRDGDHRLDRVRGLERAQQRRRQPETGDRERLGEALADRGSGAGMLGLQMLGQRSEVAFGGRRVGARPGYAELAGDEDPLGMGQMIGDVGLFMPFMKSSS